MSSIIDRFNECVDIKSQVLADLQEHVYTSKYLPLFMGLVHSENSAFRDLKTQSFLSDVAANYAHSDINNEAGLRRGLTDLFQKYAQDRRIIDYDVNQPFFQQVNEYYNRNLCGNYNPAQFRNYVNGYLITDSIKNPQDIELAINNSVLHGDATCEDLNGQSLVMN